MAPAERRNRRRTPGTSSPVPVGSALRRLSKDLGIDRTLREYEAVTGWSAIVGEQVAKVSRASHVDRGILYVTVHSAPWRAELTLRRREIIGKVNKALGDTVIREIRFR